MREIKSITVQGLGHWQIGDKIGDGVIHGISRDPSGTEYTAYKSGYDTLAQWLNMPVMAIFGEQEENTEWKK